MRAPLLYKGQVHPKTARPPPTKFSPQEALIDARIVATSPKCIVSSFLMQFHQPNPFDAHPKSHNPTQTNLPPGRPSLARLYIADGRQREPLPQAPFVPPFRAPNLSIRSSKYLKRIQSSHESIAKRLQEPNLPTQTDPTEASGWQPPPERADRLGLVSSSSRNKIESTTHPQDDETVLYNQ